MTTSHVRLFVALDLPERARSALVRWRDPVAATPGLRPLGTDSLHVTLCFLGWREPSEQPEIEAACSTAMVRFRSERDPQPAGPLRLRLAEALWLPPRRPRVLVVRLGDRDGGLAQLQGMLSDELQSRGLYEPERRAFLAHVSVARVKQGSGMRRGIELPALPSLEFEASRITLYQSRLGAGGARYEPLAPFEL